MDLFAAINPLLVVSGFVVGILVGLTGVGGGSPMTPILVLLFGVHATTAVGTDLLYAAITKPVSCALARDTRVLNSDALQRRPSLGALSDLGGHSRRTSK